MLFCNRCVWKQLGCSIRSSVDVLVPIISFFCHDRIDSILSFAKFILITDRMQIVGNNQCESGSA